MRELIVVLRMQVPDSSPATVDELKRELEGGLEVGAGSEEFAPNLNGSDFEVVSVFER